MAYTKNASLKSVTDLMQSYLALIGHFVLRCCNIHSSYVKIIHNICVLTRPTEATTSKKSRSHANDVSLEPFDGITLISSANLSKYLWHFKEKESSQFDCDNAFACLKPSIVITCSMFTSFFISCTLETPRHAIRLRQCSFLERKSEEKLNLHRSNE